jgi:phosphoserine phosphatase RsbU/P
VRVEAQPLEDSAEELFEDAPCGYVTTRLDGTIVRVNRTFERWTGRARDELLDRARFQDLLTAGGRIYHETHYAPLLRMQGTVREIALDILRADGTTLPALINSVLRKDDGGRPRVIRTTIFDATDRRRYEQELRRATQREHEIAQSLQRSLLSGELPSDPAFELEVFYASAATGLDVGGDWYDAFWLEEHKRLALVVGDIVGRGLAAAATMGQLRSAVRALAVLSLPPAALLDALDAYSRRHNVGVMTTLIYGELNLESGQLRFGCAGHPPPLILEPGQPPKLVWHGRSLPINTSSQTSPHEDWCLTLAPGSTLLLYTDGLVEHRRRPLDEGMQQLSEIVAAHGTQPLPDLVERVVRALHDADQPDDRCLAAVRLNALAAHQRRHG